MYVLTCVGLDWPGDVSRGAAGIVRAVLKFAVTYSASIRADRNSWSPNGFPDDLARLYLIALLLEFGRYRLCLLKFLSSNHHLCDLFPEIKENNAELCWLSAVHATLMFSGRFTIVRCSGN